MPGKITGEIIEAFLKCKLKAHLQMAGEKGQPHDYAVLTKESRERVRGQVRAKLLARYPDQMIPTGLPLDADLLRRGVPLLLDIVFEDDDLCVRIDALMRVDRESRLGGFQYIPVLFHEAEKPTPELRVILAALAELVATAKGRVPAEGILFHGRYCTERRMKLPGVSRQARLLLRDLRESSIDQPPSLLLNSHCQVCEFRRRCQAEALARDELSLLRGMAEAEVKKYAHKGLFTLTQLSCTFRPPKRMKRPQDRKVTHSHPLQALAVREKKVYVLGTRVLPDGPSRIYLDIEGDPERGFDYLLGLVVLANGTEERHSFWADSPSEEPRLLDQLLAVARYHTDAWFYAYGSYEAAFLRRVGKVTGRQEEVNRVLARTFNLLSVIYPHVYFPVYCNGLKDIADYLGFRWTEPDASGIQSVVWRRRWEATQDAALRDKLITYNREDCEALRKVTEFLYTVCPEPRGQDEIWRPADDGLPMSGFSRLNRDVILR